jgi:hypothetical protein
MMNLMGSAKKQQNVDFPVIGCIERSHEFSGWELVQRIIYIQSTWWFIPVTKEAFHHSSSAR